MQLNVILDGAANGFASGASVPLGHVTYMLDPEKLQSLSGRDWAFFFSPLTNPFYVTLIILTVTATLAGFAICQFVRPLRYFCRSVHNRLVEHIEYVPLILRTSLGVALIAAGVGGGIYLPNVPAGQLGGLEVGLGFCLVVGFLVRPSGITALAVFGYGTISSHYMLGALESAAVALLVVAYGPRLPSADRVLDVDPLASWLPRIGAKIRDLAPVLLRVSLGTTLIWLAMTEKFFNPRLAEAVVLDHQLHTVVPVSTAMWVFAVGVIEIAVGTVLIIGCYTRTFSLIALIILSLSFFYFKESVAGHVTFFGALVALLFSGAGPWSIDALVARRTRNARGTAVPYAL